jgi:hypothetical protein
MMRLRCRHLLIDDWRRAWRLFSVQLFALVALFPDMYDGIAALGWMDQLPEQARWAIRAMGAVGIVARVIKQRPKEIS